MDKFTDKKMTDAQITEICDLFNGEHAEALQLWTERTENRGLSGGFVTGSLWTALGIGLAKLTWDMAKITWNWGKEAVLYVKENRAK